MNVRDEPAVPVLFRFYVQISNLEPVKINININMILLKILQIIFQYFTVLPFCLFQSHFL